MMVVSIDRAILCIPGMYSYNLAVVQRQRYVFAVLFPM